MNLLVFDIETVRAFKQLSDASDQFIEAWNYVAERKYPDIAPEESFLTKAGLHPEFGKVVVISAMHSKDKDKSVVSFNGNDWVEDEAEWTLLKAFSDRISKGDWKGSRLVGHYIKGFDIPYLVTRFVANNLPVPPMFKLYGQKPWEMTLIDTRDVWKQGLYQTCQAASLIAVCNTLGIKSPKQDITGAEVGEVFWSGEEGAVDDIDQMKHEKAKPDGHININPGFNFDFRDHSQQIQGQATLLQDTKDHFDAIGPNAAQLGTQGSSASGRAILANQTSGQIRIARLLDRHRHYKRAVYRKIWSMIRQYKTEEWWVRVTDDEQSTKWVGFNRPVTAGEQFVKELERQGIPEEEIQAELQAIASTPEGEAELNHVVGVENVPAEMDMDVILEEIPDIANVQQEQFNELAKVISTGLQPGDPRLKLLITASNLRNKKQLIDMIDGDNADPQQMQLIQQNAALDVAAKQAAIEETRSKTLKNLAQAEDIDFNQALPPDQLANGIDQSDPASGGVF